MQSKPSLPLMVILGLMIAVSVISVGLNQEAFALSSAVARWTFNDGNTAIAKDTSGNGNNGIINGATVVKGKIGKALSFDGVDDVVSVPNSSTLNFGSTQSFSISLWMKSTSGEGWLVDHRRNNDGIYAGYTIQDLFGTIVARIRDSSANDVPVLSTTNVHDGKFHHIVFVVDRVTQTEKLYVDKNLEATANISTVGNIDTAFDLHLGGTAAPNTPVDFYKGVLDQVKIYNHSAITNFKTIPVGNNPSGIAFDAANNKMYVSTPGSSSVMMIDGSTNKVVGTPIPVSAPEFIAFDSLNHNLYVEQRLASGTVSVINDASNTVVNTIPVGGSPLGIAFDSTNGDIYVGSESSDSVWVIDPSTNTIVGSPIPVGDNPVELAFDSTNGDIYVANIFSNSVSVIDGTTNTVVATVPVGNDPFGVVFDSANGDVYVCNNNSNSVSVIDGTTNTVVATVPVGAHPAGIAFDSANNNLYVADEASNSVSVISDATNTVVSTIPVGNTPFDAAIDSANGDVYVTNSGDNTVSVIKP